jgi:hypothetical protein
MPDYCWMPVETRFAGRVSALLQDLREAEGPTVAPPPRAGKRRKNDGGILWSGVDLARFMEAGQKSYGRVRAFADVLAGSPEEVLTTTEACARAGIESTQLRAALGKFTQWMQATTEYEEWPFGWAFGENVDPNNPTEWHYRMSNEQARAWKDARRRSSGDLPRASQ